MKKLIVSLFAFAALAHGGFAALPAGYTRLEYVQGNGTDAYLESNFTPNPQTDKVVMEVALTDRTQNQTMFSCRAFNNPQKSWTLFLLGGQGWRFDYVSAGTTTTDTQPIGSRITLTVDKNIFSSSTGVGRTATADSSFAATDGPMLIFGAIYNNALVSPGSYKLCFFKVYRSGVLIHDLIPVTDANGKATLYDDVASPMTLTHHGSDLIAGPAGSGAPSVSASIFYRRSDGVGQLDYTVWSLGDATTGGVTVVSSANDGFSPATTNLAVGIGEADVGVAKSLAIDPGAAETCYVKVVVTNALGATVKDLSFSTAIDPADILGYWKFDGTTEADQLKNEIGDNANPLVFSTTGRNYITITNGVLTMRKAPDNSGILYTKNALGSPAKATIEMWVRNRTASTSCFALSGMGTATANFDGLGYGQPKWAVQISSAGTVTATANPGNSWNHASTTAANILGDYQ